MEKDQGNIKRTHFIEYSIILVIVIYLMASAIVPFIPVKYHNFTIIFTISAGIPAITLIFKEKYGKTKKVKS